MAATENLAADGYSKREIANIIGVFDQTVNNDAKNLVGLSNRVHGNFWYRGPAVNYVS
jgi:hypothetical protein